MAHTNLFSLPALLLALAPAAVPAPQEGSYEFRAGELRIALKVTYLEPFLGRRLAFTPANQPDKEICFSENGTPGACTEQFTGAVARVVYALQNDKGKPPKKASLRESVAVLDQYEGLPNRLAFEKRASFVKGIVSDLQVFGYDESDVKPTEREAVRTEASVVWRVYRQELYLNDETRPFAVINWKHTITRISILSISAGQSWTLAATLR
jgi:hypothetical protein